MLVLKKIFAGIILGTAIFSSAYSQGDFAPMGTSYPSITLSANGAAPAYSGIPACTQNISLHLTNATGTILSIDSCSTSRDTLYVQQGSGAYAQAVAYIAVPAANPIAPQVVAPWYAGYTMIIDTWGRYTVMLRDTLPASHFVNVGTVLIYPYFSTTPSMPLASAATQLSLVLGQSHTVCNPSYTNVQTTIKKDTIVLRYTEVPHTGPCIDLYLVDPALYGPTYNLGLLDTGSYIVKVDTMTLGTMSVANGFQISGTAMIMKNPLTRIADQPIANVLLTGTVYQPCTWYLGSQQAFDTVTTSTSSSGAFSLLLPREGYEYTIAAEKSGYYPQSIAVNTADALGSYNFQLIPKTMDTIGVLNVTAKWNSAVIESVYVALYQGRQPAMCPMYLAKLAANSSMSGYTTANGKISFSDMNLIPFIDYAYSASYLKNNQSYSAFGIVRLNPLRATDLVIDFGTTEVRADILAHRTTNVLAVSGKVLKVVGVNQSFQGTLSLYDVRGKIAFQRLVSTNARIDLSKLPAGRYLARVRMPNLETNESLLLQ